MWDERENEKRRVQSWLNSLATRPLTFSDLMQFVWLLVAFHSSEWHSCKYCSFANRLQSKYNWKKDTISWHRRRKKIGKKKRDREKTFWTIHWKVVNEINATTHSHEKGRWPVAAISCTADTIRSSFNFFVHSSSAQNQTKRVEKRVFCDKQQQHNKNTTLKW